MATDVIVLNGSSSSGKTAIVRCLQEILPETWLTLGIDGLIAALPRCRPTGEESPIAIREGGSVVIGTQFRELEAAWQSGVAAIARAGVGVIVDDVFLGGGESQDRLAAAFEDLDVLWVGVRCDVDVATAREMARGDRVAGLAAAQAAVVHDGVRYDLELDSVAMSPAGCAEVVRDWLASSADRPAARCIVVAYDEGWPARAAGVIATLSQALSPAARRIEHIGSTAIPGMAAKDVLDLQVSVDDLEVATREFDEPLGRMDYVRLPYQRDHVPAGRNDDPVEWSKRLWRRRGHPDGDVNLHVRTIGSPNERLALLFRDWLCAHPSAVAAYAQFKRSLAAEVRDLGLYTDVKDPVVDLVIAAAEPWAASVSWVP